jgi:NADH-quinone oxidoreductase subunit N
VNERLGPLAPEIILAAGAVAGLLAGSWLPRRRQWVIQLLAAAACLAAVAATAFTPAGTHTLDFGSSYSIDAATNAVRVVVAAATSGPSW